MSFIALPGRGQTEEPEWTVWLTVLICLLIGWVITTTVTGQTTTIPVGSGAVRYPATWVKDQLVKSAPEFGVPADAVINPVQRDNRIEVTVQYVIPIEFPGYTYQYNFDHTVKSTAFLTIK